MINQDQCLRDQPFRKKDSNGDNDYDGDDKGDSDGQSGGDSTEVCDGNVEP